MNGIRGISLATWVSIAWFVGLVVAISRQLQQVLLTQRLARRCETVNDKMWCSLRDAAAHELGVRGEVTLKTHAGAVSPMVIGLFRPVILLPADAASWPVERRRHVLLHELAHVGRRDVLTQSIAGLACAMYWFNPLAWWGAREMRRLREIACDDAVVTHTGKPSHYAQTLLDVAKSYRCRQSVYSVAMARTASVEGRIRAILDATRRRATLSRRSAGIVGAAALVVSVLVGSLQLSTRAEEQGASGDPPSAGKQERVAAQAEPVANESSNESRTMAVRVLDEMGRPVTQASVLVSLWEIERTGRFPTRTYTTDEQGSVDITIPRRLRILRIWPDKGGYVPQFINFAEGTHEEGQLIPAEYEFRLQRGSRLGGVVVDTDGQPIRDAKVQVMVDVREPIWSLDSKPIVTTWLAYGDDAVETNADGRWEITNAPPRSRTKTLCFGFR